MQKIVPKYILNIVTTIVKREIIVETKIFHSTVTKLKYSITDNMDCSTCNIICWQNVENVKDSILVK